MYGCVALDRESVAKTPCKRRYCTDICISTRLQLKELTVAQNEVVVLVHPAIPQIDVLPVAVNYRSGPSLAAVYPLVLFPVDGYILLRL